MKISLKNLVIFLIVMMIINAALFAADKKEVTLTCVGLYSETGAGSVSYRTGNGEWIVIKVDDVIPADAEIRINVDRDWIELIKSDNPNAVYEITGSENGDVVMKGADILKLKPRNVSFPKKGDKYDPKFKDKMVVLRYLGRQIYKENISTPAKDIKYGDVLDCKGGYVKIIAINNTLTLLFPNGESVTHVGPINFEVVKAYNKEIIYKKLNVREK